MAMLIFTGLNALGVVFLVYVLVQFWKEGRQSKKPGTTDRVIEVSREYRPTVIVVTRLISGGLQVEPAPVSLSAHGGLSVVSRQGRMSDLQDRQLHRDSANEAEGISLKRFSAR
jgi:hypothetical protein